MELIKMNGYDLELLNRAEAVERLKQMKEEGYNYMARDLNSENSIYCYSIKPKKYLNLNMWGYTDADVEKPYVLAAKPILNRDITEINFSNVAPVLIEVFIEQNGG